jgi:RND family efflux transporter MFP subunit
MNMYAKLPESGSAEVHPLPPADVLGEQTNRRPWLRPALVLLGVALAAAAVWALFFNKKEPAPTPPPLPLVSVMTPAKVPVADAVSASGSIAARRDAAVGIQGEGGRVIEVLVDPGQSVAKGQVLARIDRSVQTESVAQLAASVHAAEADAVLAEAELKRAQQLVGRGFISRADIDRKTATRDGANAKVRVARAQLAQAQAQLARLDVRAPAAGLVLSRSVETGQVVSPASGGLFRIAEGGVLEMRALVAEQDMARLKVGMPAEVTPVGSSTSYPAKIWLLDPVIDPNSRQGVARLALAYSPGLRVGAFANTRIAAGEATRPVLPQSAVLSDDNGNYVYVVDGNDVVSRRPVKTGQIGDQGIAITSGLNGSERVVVSAGAFLRVGEKIKPVASR